MKELVGKKVLKIEIDSERQWYLRFTTDDEVICYVTCSDCCSESWVYALTGLKSILGYSSAKEIKEGDEFYSAEEVRQSVPVIVKCLPVIERQHEDDGKTRQNSDILYRYTLITTNYGFTDIEFRNSSNGYYGGSLEICDSIPSDVVMVEVRDDYIAQG